MKKKKPGDNWRNSVKKGRCQAHGKKHPCLQCRKDTLAREIFMARERRILNEQMFVHRDF